MHDPDARPEDVAWRSEGAELVGDDPLSVGAQSWIPLPTSSLRESSSVADLGLWYAIGEAWSHVAVLQIANPAPRILDIGCGCGKMARFFSMNPRAAYLGIDVFRPSIEWCQRAFLQHRNFRFEHFDIRSPLYNPSGSLDVVSAAVPAENSWADLIICASLFTHLNETAFRHYLFELKRCLAPGGVAVVSTHNEPAAGKRFSGKETRIDISDEYFLELSREAGMKSEKIGVVFGQEVFRLVRHPVI